MLVRSWVHGELTAMNELAKARRRGRQEFGDPPALGWIGPPPSDAITWAKNRKVLLGKWNRDLDAEVTKVLVQTLETGASGQKMMQELSQVFPTFTKRRLEMIARTESTAALNQGRLKQFKEPDNGVEAVQFVAILDARTSEVCRPREGLIMRLDDRRLAANTPPLHINCRSTLVPILDIDLEDLEAGVPEIEEQWFGWLEDANAPRSLKEATESWDKVPAPAKGFGEVGKTVKKKPKPAKKKTERTRTQPKDSPLKTWIDERKKIGIDDPEDLREVGRRVLSDVRSVVVDRAPVIEREFRAAKKILSEASLESDTDFFLLKEAQAAGKVSREKLLDMANKSKASLDAQVKAVEEFEKSQKTLYELRSKAVIDTLSGVRVLGGVEQSWVKGGTKKTRQAVAQASEFLPEDWLKESAKFGKIRATQRARGEYGHPLRPANQDALLATKTGSSNEERLKTALHEMGHRMEYVVPGLEVLTRKYLDSRTSGDRTRRLKDLFPTHGYRADERTRPDKFIHPYFGKSYDSGTEIVSMGLESVFLGRYNVWEEDSSVLEFVIGALAAL